MTLMPFCHICPRKKVRHFDQSRAFLYILEKSLVSLTLKLSHEPIMGYASKTFSISKNAIKVFEGK